MADGDDTQKMLRVIINGQSTFRQEVLGKIDNLDQKVDKLDIKIDRVEKNLTERIDKLGKHLAYLEDDTPTSEEVEKLEKRVGNLEQKSTSAV
jgi:hypothetical protein